jgi:ASC-1-like (ASCH) protein
MVQSGRKTVEGRIRKPELQALKVNDIIRFKTHLGASKKESFVDVGVTYLHFYTTFQEMLEKEGLQRCLPDVASIQEGVKIYHSFAHYKEKELSHGILAIGIQHIKKSEVLYGGK